MLHENVTTVIFVERVCQGPRGGEILYGKSDSGINVSVAIDCKWKGRLPAKDEVWRINGAKKPHSRYPETIYAKDAVPVVPPVGELTRRFLCEAEQFRGFSFGAGKLDKLEAGLNADGISVRDALNGGQIDLMSKFLPVGMVEMLVKAWRQSVEDCDIYEFLDKHGFERSLAAAVRRVFKGNVVDRLKENPYRLLAFGVPSQNMWRKAEAAAKLLGIDRNNPKRLAASIEQALYDQLVDGHTLVKLDELKLLVKGLLKTKSDVMFEKAVRAAADQKMVVRCGHGFQALGPASMEARVEDKLVSLANLYAADCQLGLFEPDTDRLEELLSRVNAEFVTIHGSGLNPEQLEAVRAIYSSFLCVISGGAGTGKTTILRSVHDIAERTGRAVFQMALCGRAKERLEEVTRRKAYTIHAFIERLKRGKDAPESKEAIVVEEGAHIVIDEASMVDLTLLHKLLSLLPDKVRLCFVGDPGQLPPIGFGIVFHLMVGVKEIRNVELKKIVRQKDITGIPGMSMSVRAGCVPALREFGCVEAFDGGADGVSFVAVENGSNIAAALYEISSRLGHDCQVLCVRRRFGDDSSVKVNRFFQYRRSNALSCEYLSRWGMFVGEPVIVTRNSYELNLFNGTLGNLVRIDGHYPVFRFKNNEFKLNDEQMVEVGIELAYGITVHKAQGSEFDHVIIPVTESKGLDRSLLYTALTRARKHVVFVGNRIVFERAIKAEPNVSSVSVGFDLRAAMTTKGA